MYPPFFMRSIESKNNAKYKQWLKIARGNVSSGEVLLDSVKILAEAVAAPGVAVDKLIFAQSKAAAAALLFRDCLQKLGVAQHVFEKYIDDAYVLPDLLFARLSDTGTSQGLIGILQISVLSDSFTKWFEHQGFAKKADTAFNSAKFRLLVLCDLQDPGNVGSMIRTADAFAYDAVIVAGESAAPFAPKALRASMGSYFHLPVMVAKSSKQALQEIQSCGITTIGMALCETQRTCGSSADDKPLAIVIGNEGKGLGQELQSLCTYCEVIPMKGRAESLNAAAACAIALYCYRA